MRATLILDSKTVLADGRLIQRRVWQLPAPTAARPYALKFSLYCGKGGKTIVRYDNEAGKAAHRHVGADEHEEAYAFVSLVKLLKDFQRDIVELSGEIK
jgi:hypothetical protein